jgi:hypothetical protein
MNNRVLSILAIVVIALVIGFMLYPRPAQTPTAPSMTPLTPTTPAPSPPSGTPGTPPNSAPR